jgi:hypothetical protein
LPLIVPAAKAAVLHSKLSAAEAATPEAANVEKIVTRGRRLIVHLLF